MSVSAWINRGWHYLSRQEGVCFQRSTGDVANVQWRLLEDMLRRNAASVYGRTYDFGRINSVDEYQASVPIVRYEDIAGYIGRIMEGEHGVLTVEPVERLLPTSGSSGGIKLIPYTASLKRDFRRAIAAWIWSTFRRHPKAMCGRAYWSITPMAATYDTVQSKVPIGFAADSEYLGVWSRWLAEQLILPPGTVSRLRDIENARYANLLFLLASVDLALVSVWSPTFLLTLLKQIEVWFEPICRDIADGTLRLPNRTDFERGKVIRVRANRKRAEELKRLYLRSGLSRDFLRGCWPSLGLLSCWGDGNSASYFSQLRSYFPDVPMEPKGLLSTECVVSVPAGESGGNLLAMRSHFFEFAQVENENRVDYKQPLLAEQLAIGNRYRVLVTSNGGMYRYDLGDVVEVTGFDGKCPQVRFVGRMDAVSDLVGEKLYEDHVRKTLEEVFGELELKQQLYLVTARESPTRGYVLYVSGDTNLTGQKREAVCNLLDNRLRLNPQYDLARNLRQLERIDVEILPIEGHALWSRYEEWQAGKGKRVGDLKVNVLDYRGTWREFLSEQFKSQSESVRS